MILVNELRVGNWFRYNDNYNSVSRIYIDTPYDYVVGDGFRQYTQESIEPIPITPEKLEAAGFKEVSKGLFDYHVKYFTQTDSKGCEQKSKFSLGRNGTQVFINDTWLCGIEYVHQLQNLWYCLAGEELEISLLSNTEYKKEA